MLMPRAVISSSTGFVAVVLAATLPVLTACEEEPSAPVDGGNDTRDAGAERSDASLDAATWDASAPPCDPSLREPGRNLLGFAAPNVAPIEPTAARVVTASADGLMLQPSDGVAVAFPWAGPSLSDAFEANEPVRFWYQGGWSVVVGASHTAAIMSRGTAGFSLPVPPAIEYGPSFKVKPFCGWISTNESTYVVETTRYELEVTVADSSVVISPGATARVGAWRVTNIQNLLQHVLYQQQGFYVDPAWWNGVAALGPPLADPAETDADAGSQ
jgi:hypothetical protein